MMATEVISGTLADASIPADIEQTPSTQNHDVINGDDVPVNGELTANEIKHEIENIESANVSADVSVNGGSDSEALKADSNVHGDGLGHIRNSSTIKKPISFKAVSVNKTFLAAKGTASAATPKPGEKAAPGTASLAASSLALGARPRLVAKSGSGLREAPRTSTTANGGKAGATPDGSAVWNKNRPAPPPEQKRFTDEELKQQYGIHLATRLHSDEPGRQANWADIDDEDDDWAPESIEWTDGTKVSLPQAEDIQQTPPKPIPSPLPEEPVDIPLSRSPAPSPSVTSSVKLGGISSGSGRGLILKGASEKPTLVAKPPVPTQVKSPWATLPPVDKAAPIALELQQPQSGQPPRFVQRDPHGFDAMPQPPAKEIAADDFSRTWRDSNMNGSRELYNSQSGRYEPVNDDRRRSSRNDGGRQPALLQRPSQGDGPAEPSAAFQTHRATGQEASFGRRRASSSLSIGSGNIARRMSKGGQEMHPHPEMLHDRRGSLVAVSDAPSSPRTQSPSGRHPGSRVQSQQPWQGRDSSVQGHPSPASVHRQMAHDQGHSQVHANPLEDDLELQKKIMRESRELARKRRLEEEAREDAERKERIRLKLEAMGPPPEKKNKKEATKEERATPVQIQSRDNSANTSTIPEPPTMDNSSEVRQYGMMKVHPSEPVSSAQASHNDEAKHQSVRQNGPPATTASNSSAVSPPLQPQLADNKQPQTWQEATPGPERFSTWGTPATNPNQGRNVWGPPSNDKSLGNGTFNPELSRLPEMHGSPQLTSTGPGPIGPPSSNTRPNGQYQNRGREQYAQRPAPIGPPNRQQDFARQDQYPRSQATAAWNNLPEQLTREDALMQEQKDAARREAAARSDAPDVLPTVFKDTWRQVNINDDGTRSRVQGVSHATLKNNTSVSAATGWKDLQAPGQRGESSAHSTTDEVSVGQAQAATNGAMGGMASLGSSPAVRGSRFFPSRDVRLEDANISFTRPGSPSPPPPTMAGHPAYDGDTSHPHVSFPRPPPVVKLPPSAPLPVPVLAPIGPPKPTSFAAAVAAPVIPQVTSQVRQRSEQQQPSRSNQPATWQDRINSLVGRKSSPPKTNALAVDSSSKNALELPALYSSATVSLPATTADFLLTDGDVYESKPSAEECFEEQEMGSLPTVRLPARDHHAVFNPTPQIKSLPKKFQVTDVASVEEPRTYTPGKIAILLPGMPSPVLIAVKDENRQRSNPRRGGSRGGASRHSSSTHPRGGRPKDSSPGYSTSQGDHGNTPPAQSPSSRGARSRGAPSWNQRHVSTPAINV